MTKPTSAELSNLLARQSRLVKEIRFIENALKAIRREKHKLEIEKLQIVHSRSRLKFKSTTLLGDANEENTKPLDPEYNMDEINVQNLELQVPGVIEVQNNEFMPSVHPSNCFPQSSYNFTTQDVQPCSSHYFVNNYENTCNNPNPGNCLRHPNICVSDLMTCNQFYMQQ